MSIWGSSGYFVSPKGKCIWSGLEYFNNFSSNKLLQPCPSNRIRWFRILDYLAKNKSYILLKSKFKVEIDYQTLLIQLFSHNNGSKTFIYALIAFRLSYLGCRVEYILANLKAIKWIRYHVGLQFSNRLNMWPRAWLFNFKLGDI